MSSRPHLGSALIEGERKSSMVSMAYGIQSTSGVGGPKRLVECLEKGG